MNTVLPRCMLAALALSLAWGAVAVAVQHPLAPALAVVCLLGVLLLSAWRPSWWLFLLPALLPVLNFSPWTGWWLLDESDLLVLGLAAGAYARWSMAKQVRSQGGALPWWLWGLLWVGLALGIWAGAADAGLDRVALTQAWNRGWVWTQGLYASYDSAWNTLRVAKSLVWALLLAPLLRSPSAGSGDDAPLLLSRGMVVGLTLVCMLLVRERLVYAGLFEFSLPYRTSAWFWEMHVGGAAIDAYLAVAAPFAFWAMWSARTLARWLAANVLLWVTVYAVLTTYSRGVCMAVLLAMVFVATVAWRHRIPPAVGQAWGPWGITAMLAAIVLQSVLVLGSGTFMVDRLMRSDVDMVGRMEHWKAGVSLLKDRGRDRLALGLGIGRLPAQYSQRGAYGELSGTARWQPPDVAPAHIELKGPPTRDDLLGMFRLTQQVVLEGGGQYRARLRVRADAPSSLIVSLCERHLLYRYRCQWQYATTTAPGGGMAPWLDVPLEGDEFEVQGVFQRRSGVFAISTLEVGSAIRIEAVELLDPRGQQVLHNTEFAQGMQHWFTMARGHFLPWHMDNLYLELLIERGLLGWLVLGTLAAWAVVHLIGGLRRGDALALVLAGSLLSMGLLGMVVSAAEIPRVALLLLLILFTTSRLQPMPRP